jgi:hypothetical protein
VYRGEGLPEHLGVVDQAISGVNRLLQIEARKRPVSPAREGGLAITDKAGGDIGGIANAMEGEFVDHQARHDLGLAGALQIDLDGQQILLADQKCEQPDLQPVEMIVHIAQPFVLVVVVALCLIDYSRLNPIQIFRHNGYPFRSNDSAELLYYGPVFCVLTRLRRLISASCSTRRPRHPSVLPSASSRFAVARGTLAVQLTLPLVGRVEDFHLQLRRPPAGCGHHQARCRTGGHRRVDG